MLSMKELFLITITKPPEVLLINVPISVSVSFSVFPSSKGQVVKAYLDTIFNDLTVVLSTLLKLS